MDNIPAYDPSQEQRKKPRTGDLDQTGIWVGTGETRKLVNPEIVWVMAEIGCPDAEIAEWLGITESTFRFNFSGYATKARSQLKQKLRRAQIHTALGGSVPMLIWLGKNILGQSDNPVDLDKPTVLPWITEQLKDHKTESDLEADPESD